jgi:hypothetical protein
MTEKPPSGIVAPEVRNVSYDGRNALSKTISDG